MPLLIGMLDIKDQRPQKCWVPYKVCIPLSLTLYVDPLAADNIIGVIDGLTVVGAAVLFGQPGDLVVCMIVVGGGGEQRLFVSNTVPLKGYWRCALDTTYQIFSMSIYGEYQKIFRNLPKFFS